ncbi:hypothetical protein BSL82_05745 [Tardibacter chloracetimidivorans]|uniref:Terminase n=1 Tax=Tardibacter chloracetimidivorans TaxID=1921510 RepID=A0A1L3ZTC3_9SPHN|nr:P27 family phage terminase small subunit [Tardibacter chloracetimidivorans]API58875.1 hypothetical protein BSL82_05745 [Tardibacter chloracetimidivorans]
MSRRGPKPEPAAVKVAKGNSGRRRIGADPAVDAPAQDDHRMAAPAWLKDSALEVWNDLMPRLVAMKLAAPVDAFTLGRYCKNFALWLSAMATLDGEQLFYEVGSQHLTTPLKRRHPALDAAIALDRRLESFEDRYGLNTAERQRIFAARASAGNSPDLFGGQTQPSPAAKPAAPSVAAKVSAKNKPAVGFLMN